MLSGFFQHCVAGSVMLAMVASAATAQSAAPSAGEYRQLGLGYRQQGRYEDAIAAFQKSVALEPHNVSAQVLLGWTQHLAKQPLAAAQTLQTALSLNPFNVETSNALGIVHLVGGDLAAAVLTHSWATLLKPDNEISYYNLSLAWQRLGQYDFAIATAQVAAQLEPSNPHPLLALAMAQWGNGDRTVAHQSYRQALSLNPGLTDATFLQEDLIQAAFSLEQVRTVRAIAN